MLANLGLFIVNVALPDIARDFPASGLARLSWILNGYAIVYAALLAFFGRLAERYRRDRSFLFGVGLFTAASAACAAAMSVEVLVMFRLVQAAGAAPMTPTSLGLLMATFPPERRGRTPPCQVSRTRRDALTLRSPRQSSGNWRGSARCRTTEGRSST